MRRTWTVPILLTLALSLARDTGPRPTPELGGESDALRAEIDEFSRQVSELRRTVSQMREALRRSRSDK